MRKEAANTDEAIAKIAGRQHGVISTAQLASAGIPDYGVSRRAKVGRLHRLHRGVYAVGHTDLSFEGRCTAAALALGDEAFVSHRSAAAVWRMLLPRSGPIDVTLPSNTGREKRPGIRIHRSATLTAGVRTRRHNVPITSPARTLRDLRRVVPQPVFRAAIRRALDLRLIRSAGLSEADLTRSELERKFLSLCRRHRFPQPQVNVCLGTYEVDFLWPEPRLIVEVDGFRHHGHRAAFESDRGKDTTLLSRGFRVLRFTYRQVTGGDEVVEALRALLGPVRLLK